MIYAARYETMNALLAYPHRKLLPGRSRDSARRARNVRAVEARRKRKSGTVCHGGVWHEASARSRLGRRSSRHRSGSIRRCSPRKPAVVKPDYAKWMLDDPRVNFAISTRGRAAGPRSSGHSGREQGRTAGSLCAPAQGRRRSHRARANHLLLREVGKILDRRSGRHRVGDISHHRRKHRLWRRHRRAAPRIAHEKACCAPKQGSPPKRAPAASE